MSTVKIAPRVRDFNNSTYAFEYAKAILQLPYDEAIATLHSIRFCKGAATFNQVVGQFSKAMRELNGGKNE